MKIVALIEVMNGEQDKAFISFVERMGWGYWHWVDGSWLITTASHIPEATALIRDEIQKISPGKKSFVFEVDVKGAWNGFGPNTKERDMFDWIRSEWNN